MNGLPFLNDNDIHTRAREGRALFLFVRILILSLIAQTVKTGKRGRAIGTGTKARRASAHARHRRAAIEVWPLMSGGGGKPLALHKAGASRNELADDHVLFESHQMIGLPIDG